MLKNKASFDYFELEAIFGKNTLKNLDKISFIRGISTDSRTIENENAFIALKGDRFDGHDKVTEAFEKGASLAVVSTTWYTNNLRDYIGKSLIVVDDTLTALSKLAKYHRLRFDIPVVAVAGSNGKTTTKEMIYQILSSKGETLKTIENYNNQIGVPLMLLQLNDNHKFAVIEIGTNMSGEIYVLSEMTAPTHGIITNIGKEHLEQLIDIDGVEMEETQLFGYLKKTGGKCLINNDDKRLKRYSQILDNHTTYGIEEESNLKADFSLNQEAQPEMKLIYNNREVSMKMNTYGIASAKNAIAAAAVAIDLDCSLDEIKNGLENFKPIEGKNYGRMRLENAGEIRILNDCYNANPESMAVALDTLDKIPANRKFAVLGDMLELGNASDNEHIELLKSLDNYNFSVILHGPEISKAFSNIDNNSMEVFDNKEDIIEHLNKFLQPGDLILIKASRGIQLEKIVKSLKELFS